MSLHKALFLDRDGVVNEEYEYVHKEKDFDFIPGIFELVEAAQEKGYKVIIITNQAGIGRGFYTEEHFLGLMDWVQEQLPFDKVYYCPNHPEYGLGKYRTSCNDRKPAPGMFLKARDEMGIDLAASIMVGDRETDMQAAKNAGVGKKILFNPQDLNVNTIADRSVSQLEQVIDEL